MKDLRNFKDNRNLRRAAGAAAGGFNKDVNAALERYGSMDEDALVGTLMQKIRQAKDDGTYDGGQMERFVGVMRPFLSDGQRKKLSEVIKIIENEG